MKVFECKKCGDCCFGEGGVTVHGEEIDRIAGFLGTSRKAFIAQFCQEKNDKVSIKVGLDGYCIFYDQKRLCVIHPVKPRLCALWPFYPALIRDKNTWEMAKEACPGINPDCPFEEFVRQGKGVEQWSSGKTLLIAHVPGHMRYPMLKPTMPRTGPGRFPIPRQSMNPVLRHSSTLTPPGPDLAGLDSVIEKDTRSSSKSECRFK